MTCTEIGCGKATHSRGLCGTHYQRFRRNGSAALTVSMPAVCAAPGCARPNYAQSFCTMHYQRIRATGQLAALPTEDVADRFQRRYRVADTGCWIWLGAPGLNGYGRISVGGHVALAHRLSWQLHRGPIPPGFSIDPLCRVRICVNPDHLEPVTLAENTRREMLARKVSA